MNVSKDKQLQDIVKTVQHNCHIADARHAGDFTLCVYLLKMREMYRWEQGMDFKTLLTTDDVGEWLTQREGEWDAVEKADYKTLEINGKHFKPFDNELINTLLDEKKLVYNAGLGIRCRPHFFIAELEEVIHHDEYRIYISGKEFARDMAAPPAMAQENNIFIRKESLRRVIWEILDDARVAGLDNPLTRAMSFYEFDTDAEHALNEMTEVEMAYVIEHEIGEVLAGKIVGDIWNDMLDKLAKTHAEIMLRAIRDHLADSIKTLPELIRVNNPASIHFYFGNMTAMRKQLAPKLMTAYQFWHETNKLDQLEQVVSKSKAHWQRLTDMAIAQFSVSQKAATIEEIIKENKLA